MTQENKTDNELIAEFMGDQKINPSKRRYETSWDWLMPVVEKIEQIIKSIPHNTPFDESFNGTINTDIKVAYEVVIEFIKWYNSTRIE